MGKPPKPPKPQNLHAIAISVDGVRTNLYIILERISHKHRKSVTRERGKQEMLNITVGHQAALSITYLDQNGNPMLTTPTPDAAPSWANSPSDPSVDRLTPAADGNTATLDAMAVGTDTVSLSLTVGGKSFAASLQVGVEAAPQVLDSIRIEAVVS